MRNSSIARLSKDDDKRREARDEGADPDAEWW
jgi:hypothetical protein